VEGRTRKVKFSVASSAITALTGLALMLPVFRPEQKEVSRSADTMIMENAAQNTASTSYAEPFLMASVLLFTISVSALIYGLLIRSLSSPEE